VARGVRGTAGLLYVADVGQNRWEEVDVVAGTGELDVGWNRMEGSHCSGAITCDRQWLTLPAPHYGRDDGCAIVGGFVYCGRAIPSAVGHYFFSDY
jgi:hypothetical protein